MSRHPWKSELTKLASDLKKKTGRTEWSSVVLTNLEQNIYWAFLIIRKLLESGSTKELEVPVISYRADEEGEHLRLSNPREQRWLLTHLCNEIVHSVFFAWNFWDDGTLRGFFFCSGRRMQFRILVPSRTLLSLLVKVGNGEDKEEHYIPIKFTTKRENRKDR